MSSKFTIYSVGTVLEDKNPGDWDIEVIPTELIVDMDGIVSTASNKSATVKDSDGKVTSINISTGHSMKARWLQFGSSRSTPPDVCKGETVLLFHYEGADMYYWLPLFFEPDLRKQETAVFYFANRTDITNTVNLLEQGYYFKVDTRSKLVTLFTGTNDNEASGYDFTINTKDGTITLKDTKENSFILNSPEGKWNIKLKKDITIEVDNDVNIKAKNHMQVDLKTVSIKNDTGELIAILLELMDALIAEQHLGNLGSPTALMPSSTAKYNEIKSKIQSFKK